MGENVRKVGVILVHGIGEQRRFEHLDQQLRPLLNSLRRSYPGGVTVEIRSADASIDLAAQEAWVCGPLPSVCAVVKHDGGQTHLMVHEVWWADVNEPYSLRKWFGFWAWGMSIWNFPSKFTSSRLQLARTQMETIDPSPCDQWNARLKMLLTAVICLLLALPYGLLGVLLQKLLQFRTPALVRLLVNYLSSLKLYNQGSRWGAGLFDGPADFLDTLNEPPRVSIRRRMIRTLADVACQPYDEWYVLAHSLGSVVAFNGLMEPGYVFPHYLDEARWVRLKKKGMGGKAVSPQAAPATTLPARPAWLKPDEIASRPAIFSRFRGLLTYGCPLGKFSAIWPALIPYCREPAFPADAIWINALDPLDPVSGPCDALNMQESPPDPSGLACCPPRRNIGYKSYGVLLLAHIGYLTPRPKGDDLVSLVGEWLLHGNTSAPKPSVAHRIFSVGDATFRSRTAVARIQTVERRAKRTPLVG